MKLYVRNTENGLIPLYDSDLFEKKKLKINEDYEVIINKKRNIQFHKKYFALIKLTWLNMPEYFDTVYPDYESLRKALQVKAGHVESYYLLDGTEVITAKSICFDSMDETYFSELYNSVLDVIIKHILPHNTAEEIKKEIYNFL